MEFQGVLSEMGKKRMGVLDIIRFSGAQKEKNQLDCKD